jgi:nickel transport protein
MRYKLNLQLPICNYQFAIILSTVLFPTALFAHGMDVFATVHGKTIQGKASYHDGTAAKDCDVKAFNSTGDELGRTKTDDDGKFSIEAKYRCEYRILVDAADGHGGDYVVPAAALPNDLPTRDQATATESAHDHEESEHGHTHGHAVDENCPGTAVDIKEIEELHSAIDSLQEQLNRHENRTRFRDILGGIGFIVGIFGAAYGCYYRGLVQKNRQT